VPTLWKLYSELGKEMARILFGFLITAIFAQIFLNIFKRYFENNKRAGFKKKNL